MGSWGVTKRIGSNASAGVLDLFKNMPIFGAGRSTQRAVEDLQEAFSTVSKNGKRAERMNALEDKSIREIQEHAKNLGITDDKMEEFGKAIDNGTASSKYGMDEDAMNNIRGRRDWINQSEEKMANDVTRAVAAPLNVAKEYMLEGSPLRTYAKVAIPYVGYQMATGQRESLTQKNGQRDIAGIPFV